MTDRKSLRTLFRHARQRLSDDQRNTANRIIVAHLLNYPRLTSCQRIAAYLALPEEVDVEASFPNFWQRNQQILLPRTQADHGMSFHAHERHGPLETNALGIREPMQNEALDPKDIDAFIVPLVAFDDTGTRLGMGGGYYDRYLPNARSSAPRIGVAFACQQSFEPLPREAWDMALDAVVTENGVLELDFK